MNLNSLSEYEIFLDINSRTCSCVDLRDITLRALQSHVFDYVTDKCLGIRISLASILFRPKFIMFCASERASIRGRYIIIVDSEDPELFQDCLPPALGT